MALIFKVSEVGIEEAVIKAAKIIRKGGIVAFPTETVYGLGANALDEVAVNRIFEAKGRPPDNPLIVHVSSIEQVDILWRNVPEIAYKLMETFWPGPLTIVLPKREIVPYNVTGGLDTVAVRMPKNAIALKLIECSDVPIAAPSANRSGRPSPTRAEDVLEDLDDKIDAIIDGGRTEIGVESTVVSLVHDPPAILRPGGLPIEEIRKVIPNVVIHPAALGKFTGRPESPGMKYRHYAPSVPLILVSKDKLLKTIEKYSLQYNKVGLLSLECVKLRRSNIIARCFDGDIKSMAKELFSALRDFEKIDVDVIIAVEPPLEGLGLAIYNRLKKAASEVIS
ncbi:MAG: threonylcarbamoyl-AMP synthase [Thermoplasmata archaeon]|nr:threonylcarbamoyl-AMP synthase [Euryarchaeota archaeon]RLF65469.1 MAG: threonylcarbamoyl-AMP synthase [Thermoplasmata archaeon]